MEMKKFYYLSTCDTCKRIMKNLYLSDFEIIDIKKEMISKEELQYAKEHFESYLDLFNKRARKIKELGIDLNTQSEDQLEKLILSEYSFLKRPLMIDGNEVLAGNSKNVVAQMEELHGIA